MEDNMSYIPDNLPDDVRWGFTREGLASLRHYAHPIPHGRGFVKPHMEGNWPGLDWHRAMKIASEAGVWVRTGRGFTGLEEAPHVKELHVLHDGTVRVIELTPDEQVAAPTEPTHGATLIELPSRGVSDDGSLRDLARAILEGMRPPKRPTRE
jgi:hypothetical protein